jgi:hypothetical protein
LQGNVLRITPGVNSSTHYDLRLDPTPAADFSSMSFKLSSDGNGGTDINVNSGLSINVTYDSSVSNAPASFQNAVAQAVKELESQFTNPVTLNIDVGWGIIPVPDPANPFRRVSGGGANYQSLTSPYTYSQILAHLSGQSLIQQSADNTLPTVGDPTNFFTGANFPIPVADAQALGLVQNNSVSMDGWVGIGPSSDLIIVAEHEITEVMGRVASIGGTAFGYTSTGQRVSYPNAFSTLDLFRYYGPNVSDTTFPAAGSLQRAYFSIDKGLTNLGNWNNVDVVGKGDLGDWIPGSGPLSNDAFNTHTGPSQEVSLNDRALMNVIGWDTSAANAISQTDLTHIDDDTRGAEILTLLKPPSTLTVAAGGSVPLGAVIVADSDDALRVTISGIPSFESITAGGTTPTITSRAGVFTYTFNALPIADWNNGLILHSTYAGKRHPTNVLTVTVPNTTQGETSTAKAKKIRVTDPPVASGLGKGVANSDLLSLEQQTSLLWTNNAKLHEQMVAGLHDALVPTNNDTPLLYDNQSALFGQAMASLGSNDLSTAHDTLLPSHGGFHELAASDTHTLASTRAASSADTILAVPHHV